MIDIDAILTPISEENPAGEDLRYTPVYDEIKEARRADDPLAQGDWKRELKTSDWDEVIKLSEEALKEKTKDLQIAAWMTEALTHMEGFDGCHSGFEVVNGLLQQFWESLYPEVEDDDLDFRAAPLEFLNNNLPLAIHKVPLTDPKGTSGYSWIKYQEGKDVGYEETTRDPEARAELINEGKLEPEVFDAAVARSSKSFYVRMSEKITACIEDFNSLDKSVDDQFGRDAPRLSEIGAALKNCEGLIADILKKKREQEPDEEVSPETTRPEPEAETPETTVPSPTESVSASVPPRDTNSPSVSQASVASVNRLVDTAAVEADIWKQALQTLQSGGIKKALEQLMGAAYSAPSVREKNRYRLLMAKLCLHADRPDLARPIAEELNALVEELTLSRWESPIWIAEVMDILYRCLTSENASSDDQYKAQELFQKLCTTDVTKAIGYKGAT